MPGETALPARHQAVLAKLGRLALENADLGKVLHESASLVADTLGVEFCKILELLPDGEFLLLRAGVGWKEGLVGEAVVLATSETHAGHTLASRAPVIVEDFRAETRFRPSLLHDHDVASGVSVVIPGAEPFGVLGVHTGALRTFSPHEVDFLESAAEILSHAVHRSRTHEAIRQQEELFRRTFEDSPIGMTIIDPDHRFVRANRVICEMLGYSAQEFQQLTVEQITHPGDLPKTIELTGKLFRGEVPHFRLEKRNLTKRGETVWVDVTVTLVRDDQGHPLHAVSMIEDISAQRQRERDLRLAHFTVEHAQEAIFWAGPDGRLRDVNESVCRMLGYTREQLLTMSVSDLDENVSAEAWPRLWGKLSKRGVAPMETRLRSKLGDTIPAELTINRLKLNGDEYSCIFARDITARKRAEEELKASEERGRALIENARDLITILDASGTVRYVSPSEERVLGYKPEERAGRSTFELIHPDDLPKVKAALARGARTPDATANLVVRVRHKDGSWRHLEAAARNLLGNPAVAGFVVNSRDITERKLAEEKVRASEEWFRSSFEYAGVPTAITSDDGRFLEVNPAMCRFLGRSERELLKLSWIEITQPEDMELSRELRGRLLAGEAPTVAAEKRYVHKDGRVLWGYLTLSLIRDAAGGPPRVAAQIVDVTDRKLAEEDLRRAHQFSRQVIDIAQVIILVLDGDGRIVLLNRFLEELSGQRLDEVRGKDWFGIFVPKRERHKIRKIFKSAVRGTRTRGYVNPIVTKDGREREIEWHDAALTDTGGRFTGLLCIGQDVTERRRADEAIRKSEAALRASQEVLRALAGQLLGNEEEEHRRLARELHDDFSQRLTAVAFELAGMEEACPANVPALLKKKLHGSRDQIANLSEDMRRLAHQLHPAAIELLGLPAALRQQCHEASQPGGIQVRFTGRKLPESIPRDVALCLYRISQESLRNIAKHARAGKVSVTLSGEARRLRLSIKDNGSGFDQDTAQTKGGLGLISMRERVRLLGGSLSVKSVPGEGTQVVAEAPLHFEG